MISISQAPIVAQADSGADVIPGTAGGQSRGFRAFRLQNSGQGEMMSPIAKPCRGSTISMKTLRRWRWAGLKSQSQSREWWW